LKNDRNRAEFDQIDFMIGKIKSKVKFSTTDSIISEGLHLFLNDTKKGLFEIGKKLSQSYFAYA